jgi:hypothetical protein
MRRIKYNWIIGMNLQLGRVEIHRNDPKNPSQVSHLVGVEVIHATKVPIQRIRDMQKALDTLMDLHQ